MMLPVKDDALIVSSRIGSPSTAIWLCLSAEFLIGATISVFLSALEILKSLLPKPPRDLTGDVVVVAGASSSQGESLAEEFIKGGCSVICVDKDARSLEKMSSDLRSRYPRIEEIGPDHRKREVQRTKPWVTAYECDLQDRDDIRRVAHKVKDEVGRIDVLVTCSGTPNEDIFDTANTTLMSHYWTVLAFLPSMLHRERAHVIGITPTVSNEDAYLGSRAAIAALMESLGQELSDFSSHVTFLAVSPTAEHRLIKETEQQVAKDVVQAVRSEQYNFSSGWSSRMLYRISCLIYNSITTITQWLHTQGCDHSF